MAPNKIELQSLQSLMLTMRFNGKDLSSGTGFIVETPIGPSLVTNRHNVTGKHQDTGIHLADHLGEPNEIAIYFLERCDSSNFVPTWVERVEPLYSEDGTPYWKEHPQLGAKADFVLLPLTSDLSGVSLHPYALDAGEEISLAPADTVSVIGFPFGKAAGGRFGIWATGFLASEPAINYNDLPLLLIDCRTRKGQSGSPVIAMRSGAVPLANGDTAMYSGSMMKFIGIYSGRISEESDIGMVWKASAITELVRSLAPVIPNYGYRG